MDKTELGTLRFLVRVTMPCVQKKDQLVSVDMVALLCWPAAHACAKAIFAGFRSCVGTQITCNMLASQVIWPSLSEHCFLCP